MPEHDNHAKAAQAALTADMLGVGRSLDLWSMTFTLLAGAGVFMATPGHGTHCRLLFGAAILLGLVEKYVALRTQFDAAIFQRWAGNWRNPAGNTPEEDMAAFDQAIGRDGTAVRSLADRARGARRLLVKQVICAVAQTLCVITGLWMYLQ